MKVRDSRYDILKALAIILVVIGHVGCARWLTNFICLFHMPVFFMVSGWFYRHPDSWWGLYKTLVSKFRRLWFPFVFWTCAFALLHNWLLNVQIIPSVDQVFTTSGMRILFMPWSPQLILSAICRTLDMQAGNYLFFAPMWFLQSLLYAYCAYGFFDFCLLNARLPKWVRDVLLSALALLLVFLAKYSGSRHWCDIQEMVGGAKTMTAFALFHLGVMLRDFDLRIDRMPNWLVPIVGIASFVALAVTARYTTHILCSNEFHSVILLFLSSMLGWWMLQSFVSAFNGRIGWLAYIGRHTLPILILHLLSFRLLSMIVLGLQGLGDQPSINYQVATHNGWIKCLFVIVGVALPLIVNAGWWSAWNRIKAMRRSAT